MDEVIKVGYYHYPSINIRLKAKVLPRQRSLINRHFYCIYNYRCTFLVLFVRCCSAFRLL